MKKDSPWKGKYKSWQLPVDDPRHTEVLGSHCTTKHGKWNWDELDWSEWCIDGPDRHIFNPGGLYFHVRCKYNPDQDGPKDILENRRWFRVRCWYNEGGKYKGWPVYSIGIAFHNGRPHWIVRGKKV